MPATLSPSTSTCCEALPVCPLLLALAPGLCRLRHAAAAAAPPRRAAALTADSRLLPPCAGTIRRASGSACTPALPRLCLRRPPRRPHTAASRAPRLPAGRIRRRPARRSRESAWTTPRRGTSPARPSTSVTSAAGARRSARWALNQPAATVHRRPASRQLRSVHLVPPRTTTRARLGSTPRWHNSS